MSDPQVLHGLQAVDQVMHKPEFALLSKHYNVLYQSLIPNCKLTIKILRRHFTITDQMEQYILSGDSQRLCCQRVMNVLLVHLDIVKDHHQFCDWLDSVSVMGSLIDKIKTELSASDKWGHKLSAQSKPVIHQRSSKTTQQYYTQHTNVNTSSGVGSVDQLDDSVMDNVITSCTVSGEEALVEKTCSCSSSRRRLSDRQKTLKATRQSEQTDGALATSNGTGSSETVPHPDTATVSEMNLTPGVCSNEENLTFPYIVAVPSSTHTSSGTTSSGDIVSREVEEDIPGFKLLQSHYSDILQSLPVNYEATLDVLQYCFNDDQIGHILSSSDHTIANKMILELLVAHVKATRSLTELCDRLQKITTISPEPSHLISVVCKLRAVTQPVEQVIAINNLAEANDEEVSIPEILNISKDFSQLKSHYHAIVQLMPDDYEQSIGILQNHISDDQICDILCSSNYRIANNKILNCFVKKLSCEEDLLDLCDQLEKIAAAHDLKEILKKIRSGIGLSMHLPGISDTSFGDLGLSRINDHIFKLAFSSLDPNSKVVAILKKNFVGLCRCLPRDYMATIERFKQSSRVPDDLALHIAGLQSTDTRNRTLLALIIGSMNSDIEVFGICDILEDVVDSGTSKKVIQDLRSEVLEALSTKDKTCTFTSSDDETPDDFCTTFFDDALLPKMVIKPNNKVLVVLRKNFTKLCHCLPQDYKVTISRIEKTAVLPEGLLPHLAQMPTLELINCQILAGMIAPLQTEVHLIGFCDWVKRLVDDGEPKTFIDHLKSKMTIALKRDQGYTIVSLPTSEDENSDDLCTSFFDQAIAQNMVALDSNCNGLVVLRKHFTKLCHCLPQDYNKTLCRIEENTTVPDGLVPQLEKLPTVELANCHILAAMIVPIQDEVQLVAFCDFVKDLVEGAESKEFVEKLRDEVIESYRRDKAYTVLSLSLSNDGNSDGLCTQFFDQAIAEHMVAINKNSKVLAVLRNSFTKLCHCLPQDYRITISRVKRIAAIPEGLESQLAKLPTAELVNCHILAGMIRPLSREIELVGFCESMKELMDSDDCNMTFIGYLKNEVIEALTSSIDQSPRSIALCLPFSNNKTSGDSCIAFFDQAIAQHMVAIDANCKSLAVLRRNFTKLCHCLPQDYKKTINRIKRTAVVPDGMVYQLSKCPTFELANCRILGAMIRPLREEVDLLGICDSVENLVDDDESKRLIIKLRSELIEALSGEPTSTAVATTADTMQPGAVISGVTTDVTIMSSGGTQPMSNVPVTDVSIATPSNEELLRLSTSTDPLLATSVTTTATATDTTAAAAASTTATDTTATGTVATDTTADTTATATGTTATDTTAAAAASTTATGTVATDTTADTTATATDTTATATDTIAAAAAASTTATGTVATDTTADTTATDTTADTTAAAAASTTATDTTATDTTAASTTAAGTVATDTTATSSTATGTVTTDTTATDTTATANNDTSNTSHFNEDIGNHPLPETSDTGTQLSSDPFTAAPQ